MEVRKLVPDIYYKDSRDFSYIGRLFEVLINYMKTGAYLVKESVIEGESKNSSSIIVDLLATTLGFESKHEYILEDLIAICNCFTEILKKKGSIEAIRETINVLLLSQKIKTDITIEFDDRDANDYNHLLIKVPVELKDRVLIDDIFEYILPAGMTYTLINVSEEGKGTKNQEFKVEGDVELHEMPDYKLSQVSNFDNLGEDNYEDRSTVSTGKVFSAPLYNRYAINFSGENFHYVSGDQDIETGGNATIFIAADAGYVLPSTITVSGATLDYWDEENGEITVINPTSDVLITVIPEPAPEPPTGYTVTIHLSASAYDYNMSYNKLDIDGTEYYVNGSFGLNTDYPYNDQQITANEISCITDGVYGFRWKDSNNSNWTEVLNDSKTWVLSSNNFEIWIDACDDE